MAKEVVTPADVFTTRASFMDNVNDEATELAKRNSHRHTLGMDFDFAINAWPGDADIARPGNGDIALEPAMVDAFGPSTEQIAPQRVGAEFQVNTTTVGGQFAPSMTGLANGGFVVTWTDTSRTDDYFSDAVRAQLFDASGDKVGDEFLVNTTSESSQNSSMVTGLANGGFVVVWQGDSGQGDDASGSVINAQVFDANGGQSAANSRSTPRLRVHNRMLRQLR